MKRRPFAEAGRSVNSIVKFQHSPFNHRVLTTSNLAPQRIPLTLESKIHSFLNFLGMKDEYSESELEDALIRELEQFLLEFGNDFAFIARQKRLRVGTVV